MNRPDRLFRNYLLLMGAIVLACVLTSALMTGWAVSSINGTFERMRTELAACQELCGESLGQVRLGGACTCDETVRVRGVVREP